MALVKRKVNNIARLSRDAFAGEFMGIFQTLTPLSKWIGTFAAGIVILVVICAVFAPWIAPFPADASGGNNIDAIFQAPGSIHWMGTDEEGRDILSRVLFGARPALFTAVVVVALSSVIGTTIGAVAGYLGGFVEMILMRLTDFFLAFPSLLLALVITAVIGPNLTNLIISLAVSWWPWYARLAHQQTTTLREARYVIAARIAGVKQGRILARHIIPNSLTPVLVQGASDLGGVIIASAALSYLGLGVQAPAADWGSMVFSGQQYILVQWWYVTFPGIAIFATALSFNLLGDLARDLLDPSARKS